MKLILIQSDLVIRVASWFSGSKVIGTQILVWLFVDNIEKWKKRLIKMNHENIHFRHGAGLAFIGFWSLYGFNYLINLIRFKFDNEKAYRNIIFELDAYDHEKDLTYSKYYGWIKYI